MTPPNDKKETELETINRLFDSFTPETLSIRDFAYAYHKERQKIEQQAPAKTLQECKNQIGINHGKPNWLELWKTVYDASVRVEGYMEEAAELYAQQFRSNPIEVTDEEISDAAEEYILKSNDHYSDVPSFIEGAKWALKLK